MGIVIVSNATESTTCGVGSCGEVARAGAGLAAQLQGPMATQRSPSEERFFDDIRQAIGALRGPWHCRVLRSSRTALRVLSQFQLCNAAGGK